MIEDERPAPNKPIPTRYLAATPNAGSTEIAMSAADETLMPDPNSAEAAVDKIRIDIIPPKPIEVIVSVLAAFVA